MCAVFQAFIQLFSSRKGSFTVEFEKSLADKIQQKYQNSKQLIHVILHWREDEEFARQVPTRFICFTYTLRV